MKKFLSTAAVAVAALAATPVAAQTFNGPYVGAYTGMNATSVPSVDIDCYVDCDTATLKKNKVALGLTAGYDVAVDNTFVVGIEGDLGLGTKDSLRTDDDYDYYGAYQTLETKQKWISTIRARAGLALDKTMVYATGGLAMTKFRFKNDYIYAQNCTDCSYGASISETLTGYALGGGIEHSFGMFSLKAEVLHMDFGASKRACFADLAGSSAGECFDDNGSAGFEAVQAYPTTNSVRIGANFRF